MKKKGSKRFKPYQEGDQVWIEGTNLKTLYPTAKLGPKRYGPFKILKQMSPAVYQVEIPKHWKIHNVFHANLITPYCYVQAEHLARLELGGYDQAALLVVDGASASGTR